MGDPASRLDEGEIMTTAAPARRPRSAQPRIAPWAMLAPAIVLFVLFLLVPIGYAIYLSFVALRVDGGAFGVRRQVFVGFENYVTALANPEFVASLGRLALFGALSVP